MALEKHDPKSAKTADPLATNYSHVRNFVDKLPDRSVSPFTLNYRFFRATLFAKTIKIGMSAVTNRVDSNTRLVARLTT